MLLTIVHDVDNLQRRLLILGVAVNSVVEPKLFIPARVYFCRTFWVQLRSRLQRQQVTEHEVFHWKLKYISVIEDHQRSCTFLYLAHLLGGNVSSD
jgi:hypothetical protein